MRQNSDWIFKLLAVKKELEVHNIENKIRFESSEFDNFLKKKKITAEQYDALTIERAKQLAEEWKNKDSK